MESRQGRICLGPIGDPYPTDLINLETCRIPLKCSTLDVSLDASDWNHTFRSWPSTTSRCRNWYLRLSASKRTFWDEDDIGQCIKLSLSNMDRNESVLIAASHFWSDTLNVFIFSHSPMTPTLVDVLMLTGLNISAPDSTFNLLSKPSHQLENKNIGGWKGYIELHARIGTILDREHTAFLTMWLEKFVFCGKTIGPTSHFQSITKSLVSRHKIPLGKHLLGSSYSLLHHVSVKLSTGQPISNLWGPWWFINLWLNLYMHKVLAQHLKKMIFPWNHTEEEEPKTRRCSSYGEALSALPCHRLVPAEMATFFRCFYYGPVKAKIV